MDESDDYESEILFYSLNEQKRDRNRLLRRFLFLLLAVCAVFVLLILFNQMRGGEADAAGEKEGTSGFRRPPVQNVHRPPSPPVINSSKSTEMDDDRSDLLNGSSLVVYPTSSLTDQKNRPQSCQQLSYDYLQLILRWPPAMCKFHTCQNKPDRWVMYSLKPTFYNGTFASKCCQHDDFDESRIQVLKESIQDKWPSLFRDQPWPRSIENEYNKYGTCIGTGLTMAGQQMHRDPLLTSTPIQLHFVDVVRRLAIWLPDFGQSLTRNDIRPQSDSKVTYSLERIPKAFGLNHTIVPQCAKYKTNGQTYSLLDTLVVCFDRYTLSPIDCPNVVEDCQERVVYAQPGIVFD